MNGLKFQSPFPKRYFGEIENVKELHPEDIPGITFQKSFTDIHYENSIRPERR